MPIRPKLLMSAGIAFAGLGMIGAGAGATFTAQVSASTSISTGRVGLSLNGQSGPGLHLGVDGANLGSHFAPISRDLLVKNTGTLDLVSERLDVTASGCGAGAGSPLARALWVTVVDVTHDKRVYDGALCAWPHESGADHAHHGQTGDPGVALPSALRVGESVLYRLTAQPKATPEGLPEAAQNARTSLSVVFTGSDY